MKRQTGCNKAPKNISVFLRVRPPISREAKSTFNNFQCDPLDSRKVVMARASKMSPQREYFFNKVFPPSSTQQVVYDAFGRGAVEAAFDGQHGVLFVYGQTGSGKTYTISNDDPEQPGVLQQSLKDVWQRIREDTEHDYSCSISYVQLYNEILTDLLDAKKSRVRIQLGPEGRGDVVLVTESSGQSIERKVNSYEESLELFRSGMNRKEMTSTMMNSTSSRSHTIFNFNLTRSQKVKTVVTSGDQAASPAMALEGRLVICDLAGCERVSRTHAEGKTLDEATHINGSLLVLGKVVAALTEKSSQHAPFRESKLTRILQYSLLGNGNTSILVSCSPADDSSEETLSAILFGQRAIKLTQDAKRHEVLDYKALYQQLLAELDSKDDGTIEATISEERAVFEDRIRALEGRVRILTSENELLQQEVEVARSKGGLKTLDNSNKWQAINQELKEKLAESEVNVRVLGDERYRLAILLAEEKRTAFRLAKKIQAIMIEHQIDSSRYFQQVDELKMELSKAKGTDYISIQRGGVENCSSKASEDTDVYSDPNDSQHSLNRGVTFLQGQLKKAHQRINELSQERVELLAYQSKAEKAIRLLHAERTALSNRVSHSQA